MGEPATYVQAIEGTEKRFLSIAPKDIKFDSEKGFAVQLLKSNDYLMQVAQKNPQSLQQAISNVAAIGLSLNPAEKHAYLISRNVKVGKNRWENKIYLEPSYMGLIKLATDSGSILWVQANVVYEKDTFMDNGPGNAPTHTHNPLSADRGEFAGVYCVAKTKDGDFLTTVMPKADVESIRERSESWKKYKTGPWETDFNEQAKKSVIRRAFKTWPRTNHRAMAEAVHLSNENEGFEPILTAPEIGQFTADQKGLFDQMIVGNDAIGMFVFSQTLDDQSVFTSLYHSFEKGQKGKYQKIIDALLNDGQTMVNEYLDEIERYTQCGDESGIQELIADLSPDALALISGRLSIDAQSALMEFQKQLAGDSLP